MCFCMWFHDSLGTGDSRWVGVDVVPATPIPNNPPTSSGARRPATEDFVGVTDTGRFYVIRDAWNMMQPRTLPSKKKPAPVAAS